MSHQKSTLTSLNIIKRSHCLISNIESQFLLLVLTCRSPKFIEACLEAEAN